MEEDYKNFVDRMGSFEDTFDLSDEVVEHKNIVTRNRSAALTHFGIKGMRWGRRSNFIGPPAPRHKINSNDLNAIGAIGRTGQSVSQLGQTVNKNGFGKKAINEAKRLSDDELKQLTNRLNLENNYMNATSQQAGRGKVERILTTAGATMAFVSSAALMVDAINKARS